MNIDFRVVLKDVDESFPDGLSPEEVALYIAEKKAQAFDESITDEAVITADTIVVLDDQIIGKPESQQHAIEMLQQLSGRKHQVITAVCIFHKHKWNKFFDVSEVLFRPLKDKEIKFYVEKYNPLDKAGSYGIQEWIGLIGIVRIDGSYTNVVGLPTEKVYQELLKLA
jgi:septum formation protein